MDISNEKNKISFSTAVLLSVNIMVGAGLFMGPPFMAPIAGNLSYLGWALSALIFLPVVMSIVNISQLYPGEGGLYSYSKAGLGNGVGYFTGLVCFLGYAATTALQFSGMCDLLTHQWGLEWVGKNTILFSILFFALLFFLSTFNLKNVGKIQNFFTLFKLLPILFVISIFMFFTAPEQAPITQSLWSVPATVPYAIFGYWGFEATTSVSHLIRGKKGAASRAILLGFLITATISTLFHYGLLHIMGPNMLSSMGVASVIDFLGLSSHLVKNILSNFLTLSLVISYANAMFGVLNANSFLLWGIANDNQLYGSNIWKRLNKNQQPLIALATHIAIAFLLLISLPNQTMLFAATNIGILCGLILTLTSLLLIQKKRELYTKMPLTVLGFISCALFFYVSWEKIGSPFTLLPFLCLVALGLLLKRK